MERKKKHSIIWLIIIVVAIAAIILITIAGARNSDNTAYAAEVEAAEETYDDGIIDIQNWNSIQQTDREIYFGNNATATQARGIIQFEKLQNNKEYTIKYSLIGNASTENAGSNKVYIFISPTTGAASNAIKIIKRIENGNITEIEQTFTTESVQPEYLVTEFYSTTTPNPANTYWINILKLQISDSADNNIVDYQSYLYDYLKTQFDNANSSGYENGYNDGYSEGKEQILNNNFDFAENGTPSKYWDTHEYQLDQPEINPSTGERPKGFIEDWNFGGTSNIYPGVSKSEAIYNNSSPYLTIRIGQVAPITASEKSWSSAILYTDTITINNTIDNLNFILTYQPEKNPPEIIQFFYFDSNNFKDFYNNYTNKRMQPPEPENLPEYCTILSPNNSTSGNDQIAEAKINTITEGGYIFGVLLKNTNTGGNREQTDINVKNFSITTYLTISTAFTSKVMTPDIIQD